MKELLRRIFFKIPGFLKTRKAVIIDSLSGFIDILFVRLSGFKALSNWDALRLRSGLHDNKISHFTKTISQPKVTSSQTNKLQSK